MTSKLEEYSSQAIQKRSVSNRGRALVLVLMCFREIQHE